MRLQPGKRSLLVDADQPAVAGNIGSQDGGDAPHRRSLALGGTTAQYAPDPSQELARLKRLGDVVVGAGFQPDHAVDRVGSRGHHDDADPAAPLAQPAHQCEPVFAGQPDIEQDQRRCLALDEPVQCSTAVDGADPEILAGEIGGEQLPLCGLVLDHDDMRPRVHRLPDRQTGDAPSPW